MRALFPAAALLALSSPAAGQILQRPVLSAALQLELVQAAQAACRLQGHDVAVAFADPSGTVRTLVAGDDTPSGSIEAARRKARTAAINGYPTSMLPDAEKAAPDYVAMLRSIDPQFVALGGGVPVRVGPHPVGAIGVGGAPRPEADEACAKAAVATMADKLRP